jgi:hypothetical protein
VEYALFYRIEDHLITTNSPGDDAKMQSSLIASTDPWEFLSRRWKGND